MPATLTLTTADGRPLASTTTATGWGDVTLAQYLALTATDAPPAALLLTGLTAEQLNQLSPADRQQLRQRLRFLRDEQPLRELLPTPGLYEVGLCAFGLYDQAQLLLATQPDAHPLAHGALLYALYRQPTGSRAPAEQLAAAHAEVLAQPLPDVYADCQYFLASFLRAMSQPTPNGPRQPGLARLSSAVAPPKRRGLFSALRR